MPASHSNKPVIHLFHFFDHYSQVVKLLYLLLQVEVPCIHSRMNMKNHLEQQGRNHTDCHCVLFYFCFMNILLTLRYFVVSAEFYHPLL